MDAPVPAIAGANRCAYVTVVFGNPRYALGAAVLGWTLRQHGTPHDTICMYNGMTSDVVEWLRGFFTRVVEVPLISAQCIPMKGERQRKLYSHWINNSFTKWNCLTLTDYARVLFLDADSIMLSNCDELFALDAPAAVFSSPWAFPYVRGRNGATFSGVSNPYISLTRKQIAGKSATQIRECVARLEPKHGAAIASSRIRDGLKRGLVATAYCVLLTPDEALLSTMREILARDVPYGHRDCVSGFDEQLLAEATLARDMQWHMIHQRFACYVGKPEWCDESTARAMQWYADKPWDCSRASWPDMVHWYAAYDAAVQTSPPPAWLRARGHTDAPVHTPAHTDAPVRGGVLSPYMHGARENMSDNAVVAGGSGVIAGGSGVIAGEFDVRAHVDANSAAYKQRALELDPDYVGILTYIDMVKQFIVDRGGIVYGGTAIDYALRLRGDSEYDDSALTVPDLDFYMPDSVAAAYDLADMLHSAGALEARAIVAQHVETMRVDSGNNHFIADISFYPPALFARLPYVEYTGMRCVHPDYQRIDLHSSLAYPFDNAPQEVIFARWQKDVRRLRKLDAAYPIPLTPADPPPVGTYKYDKSLPLYGWAAYCALMQGEPGITFREHNGALTFNTANGIEQLCADDAKSPRYVDATAYWPFHGAIPARYVSGATTWYSTHNRLASVVALGQLVCTCVHGVLQYLMAMHMFAHVHARDDDAATYRHAYARLFARMIASANIPQLQLSLRTYGTTNINHAQEAAVAQLRGEPRTGRPDGYRPVKGVRPNTFEYASEYFQTDGTAHK